MPGHILNEDKSDKENVEINELPLETVVNQANIEFNDNAAEYAASIVKAFNGKRVKNNVIIEAAWFRTGTYLSPGKFMLAQRNRVPELAAVNNKRLTIAIPDPYIETKNLGVHSLADGFFGGYGSWVVCVPKGEYAQAWSGNKAILLGEGVHVIHDPLFHFKRKTGNIVENKLDLVDQSQHYISHGTIQILRVPSGSVAKVWLGNEAQLLDSRPQPYVYNHPLFKVEPVDKDYNVKFESATTRLICHGALKRIVPGINEVAVTNNGGKLEIIKTPRTISDPTHSVSYFMNLSVQTLEFPSDKTKEQRIGEGTPPHEAAYEMFTTGDGLKVGTKLTVSYRITNPDIAIPFLDTKEALERHIENIAIADMGKAIQSGTSSNYFRFDRTKPKVTEEKPDMSGVSAPTFKHLQDEAKDYLAMDLKQWGIELVRLNLMTPEIIDPKMAEKMGQQAALAADVNGRHAVADQEKMIATIIANKNADVSAIVQRQESANIITIAEARLKAAEQEAKALMIKATAERDAAVLLGDLYKKYPELKEIRIAEIMAAALEKSKVTFLSPDLASVLSTFGGAAFFSAQKRPLTIDPGLNNDEQIRIESQNQNQYLSGYVSPPSSNVR